MQLSRNNFKSSYLSLKPNLEIIYENDSFSEDDSFDEFKSPKTRKRGSTIGYDTPTTKTRHNSKFFSEKISSTKEKFSESKEKNERETKEVYFQTGFKEIKGIRLCDFDKDHEINEKNRAKMIDWIFEVLRIFKQNESTFYKAVFIFDLFYLKSGRVQKKEELHLNGLVSLFIASKTEQTNFISLKDIIKAIGKNKFSRKTILAKEIEILKTLNFRTNRKSLFDLLFSSVELLSFKNEELKKIFLKVLKILSRISVFSFGVLKDLTIGEISLCVLIITIKLISRVKKVDVVVFVG